MKKTELTAPLQSAVSEGEWDHFDEHGFVVLNKRVPSEILDGMCQRLDEIMFHGVSANGLMMQRESPDGSYQNAGEQTAGWKGATGDYRKITGLEREPKFRKFFDSVFVTEPHCRIYEREGYPVRFRAMIMNKSASGGTELPFHQDRWDFEDCEPRMSVYVALDPAPIDSGCVEVLAGSHSVGLLSENHRGVISLEQLEELRSRFESVFLELEAGQMVYLNCLTVHGSGLNRSGKSRRALSYLM
jgi:hypothetical protein